MPDLKRSLRYVSKSYLVLYLMLLVAGSMGTFFCAIFYLGSSESFRRTVQEQGLLRIITYRVLFCMLFAAPWTLLSAGLLWLSFKSGLCPKFKFLRFLWITLLIYLLLSITLSSYIWINAYYDLSADRYAR